MNLLKNYEFHIKGKVRILYREFKIMYYDDKYTGKVETDFVDDLDFLIKTPLFMFMVKCKMEY